jgi:hypothetical protein
MGWYDFQSKQIISLININQLVFVMDMGYVFFECEWMNKYTECVYIVMAYLE